MAKRFSRPKAMKKYLRDLKFESDFDAYYLFCMYGIALNEKRQQNSGTPMIGEFPQPFMNSREVISVSVLVASMISESLSTQDSKALKAYFDQVLTKDVSANPLSDSGVSKMDAFANKGFTEFKKIFPDCPREESGFLLTIYRQIERAFKKNKIYPSKA